MEKNTLSSPVRPGTWVATGTTNSRIPLHLENSLGRKIDTQQIGMVSFYMDNNRDLKQLGSSSLLGGIYKYMKF